MPTTPQPTLTETSLVAPAVQVSFTSIPTSASVTEISVIRTVDGESYTVRNAYRQVITGQTAFSVIDYDAPFGVPISYTGRLIIGGVDQGVGTAETITLSLDNMWISDPLDPGSGLQISLDGSGDAFLGANSFKTLKRGYDAEQIKVLGKSRPITLFYGQRALEGVGVEIFTQGEATTRLQNMLRVAPLLIRKTASLPYLPSMLYCTVDGQAEDVDWKINGSPMTRWVLTANETQPQSLDLVFAPLSYDYWSGSYATYTDVNAVYGAGTYEYAKQNPPV